MTRSRILALLVATSMLSACSQPIGQPGGGITQGGGTINKQDIGTIAGAVGGGIIGSNVGGGKGAIAGTIAGTLLGLGIGHAIQGRYSKRGWIFTVGEVGGLLVTMASVSSLKNSVFQPCAVMGGGIFISRWRWISPRNWQRTRKSFCAKSLRPRASLF